jgi:hypothetical protein
MIDKAKNAILIAVIMVLAFAFGWCANGYKIYSGMFSERAALMEELK